MELSVNHRHGGGAGDGNRIPARNIVDVNKYTFIPATDFETSDANFAVSTQNGYTAGVFTDGATAATSCTFMIPAYKRSISEIKFYYYNDTSSADVRLKFDVSRGREGVADATDTLAYDQYTTTSTTSQIEIIKVPRGAWDGLGDLQEFDLIGFTITREGGSASDTYNADFDLLGLLINFF